MWNGDVFISLHNKWYNVEADWLIKCILLLVLLWWYLMEVQWRREGQQIKNWRISVIPPQPQNWKLSPDLPNFNLFISWKQGIKKNLVEKFPSGFFSVCSTKNNPKDGWISILFQARYLFKFDTVNLSCSKGKFWFRVPQNWDPWP